MNNIIPFNAAKREMRRLQKLYGYTGCQHCAHHSENENYWPDVCDRCRFNGCVQGTENNFTPRARP